MAYVFDLELDFDQEPFVDRDGSRIIDFALGYDPDLSLIILMSVMLIPDPSGAFELCFGIRLRRAAGELDVSPPDYSFETARRFVPPHATGRVLDTVLKAISALIETAQPKDIVMETFHASLPPKAMRKYEMIIERLSLSGYRVVEQFRSRTDGKDYWVFSKID